MEVAKIIMTTIEIVIVFSKRFDFIVISHGGAPPSNPVLSFRYALCYFLNNSLTSPVEGYNNNANFSINEI